MPDDKPRGPTRLANATHPRRGQVQRGPDAHPCPPPRRAEVLEFFELYREHTNMPETEFAKRLDDVEAQIDGHGTYRHTSDELRVGAQLAWRNHTGCIGKLYWRSLTVRDYRHLTSATDVRNACVEHLKWSGNGGRIRPLVSVFAPDSPAGHGPRVHNRQLVSYAGYGLSDGSSLGDAQSIALTELAQALGWSPNTPGRFDLLPLVIETPDRRLSVHTLPLVAAREVPISHPTIPALADLGLRWYGFPTISDMALSIGGVTYPLAPFSGWYVAPEISARDFTDPNRYDLLGEVAAALGLDTQTPHSLWQDRAAVELTAAVLWSYQRAGVRIDDHHTASDRFHRYTLAERRRGREVDADWASIISPLSPSTTAVFHETYPARQRRPNFVRLRGNHDREAPAESCPHRPAAHTPAKQPEGETLC